MDKKKKQKLAGVLMSLGGFCCLLDAILEKATFLSILTGICFIVCGMLYFHTSENRSGN